MTCEVLLSFLLDFSEFVDTVNIILFVLKFYFASDLVTHCSHKQIVKIVTWIVVLNRVTVMKCNFFVSL